MSSYEINKSNLKEGAIHFADNILNAVISWKMFKSNFIAIICGSDSPLEVGVATI